MARRWQSNDRAVTMILAAGLLSFAAWGVVLLLGFDKAPPNAPDSYRTYFDQGNWWPFPFFFLALAPALWLTWNPMLEAWRRLAETGVLQKADGSKPKAAAAAEVDGALRRKRGIAVAAALLVALLVNLADWAPGAAVYTARAGLDRQIALACSYPGAPLKWIFTAPAYEGANPCTASPDLAPPGENRPGIAPPFTQTVFVAILMAQQFLIVFFAALAVVQLLLHTLLFAVLERLAAARRHGLRLMLNCRSPLNEFGLEHWNYTLNNFYWAASPAMLAVFLSRAASPPEAYLPGQVLLGFAVPVCLLAPMVATIIVRQARLPAAWAQVQNDGPVMPEDYRRQQLWPLDRNWSAKLGILLAFALAALAIGFELNQLLRL